MRRPVPKKAYSIKRTRTGKISEVEKKHSLSVWKKFIFLLALLIITAIASGLIITIGPMPITMTDVYAVVINGIIPGMFPTTLLADHIVWQIRLPRVAGAILAGFGLGVCGCVMQSVLKNPLASPFTLGISSGAQFGVSLAAIFGVVLFGGPYFLVGNAFLFAVLCSGFIIALSSLKGATSEMLILAGIAVNYMFQALNQIFNYIANDDQLDIMSSWGMGGLSDLNWNSIAFLAAITVICTPLIYVKAWDLNLMTVGDESAKSMGVDANFTRIYIMIASSLFVAAIVSFIGTIGFIGLVAPHMGRMILGSDHRYLVPAAGGLGAVILLVADAISVNLLGSVVIPTGITMSVIGVPFFLYLILRGRRKEYWT
ncbi:iron ABC transporter permease [Methanomicrobium sp. W14]|jgi:iron complex transport system permease protein|uniref:FecCD family ABC transporter permease n=1 Tax=Methanomicrobium sp. W14 TaxID=2817839 RepID=UPI001AE584F9|nr:iron ABC transporter permease [Methanomicrobium sp. W14]